MAVKITWRVLNREPKGQWYQAHWPAFTNTDSIFNEIAQWCKDNDCGKRMSYDMFRFNNKAQVTAFLLRWGQ